MDGWIKLHRKLRKHPVFADYQLLRLWIICLTEASHKEHELLVGKQVVVLQPGQFVTGRFDLHKMYNEGLKKKDSVTEYTVWRWLITLQELELVSIKSSNKFTICTIVKWAEYQNNEQQNDQQMSNKRATNEQQMSTNNNGNKGKKDKNDKENIYPSEFELFWEAYPRKVEKARALKAWNALIKKKIDPNELISCAMNYDAYCTYNQTEQRFIKHPATFLNNSYEEYKTPFLIHSKGGHAGEVNKRSVRPGEGTQIGRVGEGPLSRRAMEQIERERHIDHGIDESALPF